jgi:hypothetical protein
MFQPARQLRMPRDEGIHIRRRRRLADFRGHIQRIEIARVDEAVHGAQVNVVGVHMIRQFPGELAHRLIGRGTHARRFRAHDKVLAI